MAKGPTTSTTSNQAMTGKQAQSGTGSSSGTSSSATNTQNTGTFDNSGLSTGFTSYSPWAPAAPLLGSLLTQSGQLLNSGSSLTPAQAAGASGIESAAGTAAGFNPKLAANADYMLGGGGFSTGVPGINTGYSTMLSNLTPIASGAFTDPTTDPSMRAAMDAIQYDVNNSVGSEFSGAGRGGPMSGTGTAPNGAYANAVARGIASGEAPALANYVQQARNQQIGANSDILSGAIDTSQGLDASAAGRMGAMTTAPGMLSDMYNPYSTMFQAGTAAENAPVSYLGGVSSLFSPLAAQFGTSANVGTQANTGDTSQVGSSDTTNAFNSQNAFSSSGTNSGTSRGKSVQQQQQDPFMTAMSGAGLLGSILTAPLGGAGSLLGGTLLGSMVSDPRAKKDIQPVGMLFDGTPVHKFKYKGSKKTQIGLMSPQVQARTPQAVATDPRTGMQRVNYDIATRAAAARAPMLQGMVAH